MIDQELLDFEKLISELEEELENDDRYSSSDEFQEKYDTVKEKEQNLSDQLFSLPETTNENQWNKHDQQRKRFEKIKGRLKKIEKETDINDGSDSSWMFDED